MGIQDYLEMMNEVEEALRLEKQKGDAASNKTLVDLGIVHMLLMRDLIRLQQAKIEALEASNVVALPNNSEVSQKAA